MEVFTRGPHYEELQSLGTGMPLDRLEGCGSRPSSEEIFEQLTGTYRSDVVLVDATAAELASAHILALRRGFHVVTANKKPLTSKLADYAEIQKLRRQKGLNYQYEATLVPACLCFLRFRTSSTPEIR